MVEIGHQQPMLPLVLWMLGSISHLGVAAQQAALGGSLGG